MRLCLRRHSRLSSTCSCPSLRSQGGGREGVLEVDRIFAAAPLAEGDRLEFYILGHLVEVTVGIGLTGLKFETIRNRFVALGFAFRAAFEHRIFFSVGVLENRRLFAEEIEHP